MNEQEVADGGVIHDGPAAADEVAKLRAELAAMRAKEAEPVTDEEPADLAIEREVRKGYSKATLDGNTILVPPLSQWKSSAMRALNNGDFETWAERTLDDEGWEVWQDVDPSVDQIDEFFGSFSDQLGVDRGNSRGSRRSSRTTRRR